MSAQREREISLTGSRTHTVMWRETGFCSMSMAFGGESEVFDEFQWNVC
jgi:hypothetical protein